jgi:hypothetical protein
MTAPAFKTPKAKGNTHVSPVRVALTPLLLLLLEDGAPFDVVTTMTATANTNTTAHKNTVFPVLLQLWDEQATAGGALRDLAAGDDNVPPW